MLKPRKQIRLQMVKVELPRSSRADRANIYLGKKLVKRVDRKTLYEAGKHVRDIVEDRNGAKGDYFQLRKPLRDAYRLTQLEWLLSWVPGRNTLYMLRKFPRPVVTAAMKKAQEEAFRDILDSWDMPTMLTRNVEPSPDIRKLYDRLRERHAGKPLTVIVPNAPRLPGRSSFEAYVRSGAMCSPAHQRMLDIQAALNLLGVKDFKALKIADVDMSGIDEPERKYHAASVLVTLGGKPLDRKENARLASIIAAFLTEFRRQVGVERMLAYPTTGPQIHRWLAHIGTIVHTVGELPKRQNAIDFLTEQQWGVFGVNFHELIKSAHVSMCLLDKGERHGRIGAMGDHYLDGSKVAAPLDREGIDIYAWPSQCISDKLIGIDTCPNSDAMESLRNLALKEGDIDPKAIVRLMKARGDGTYEFTIDSLGAIEKEGPNAYRNKISPNTPDFGKIRDKKDPKGESDA